MRKTKSTLITFKLVVHMRTNSIRGKFIINWVHAIGTKITSIAMQFISNSFNSKTISDIK